ncbi:MAG TPA: hypothetical protein VF076_07250 [Acidimicrobiales bacterium]
MSAPDDAATARLLALEIEALRPDPTVPALSVGFGPFEAYCVVAALQLASRHSSLSTLQRGVILRGAHRVADGLTTRAREVLGPGSLIETTLAAGFDLDHDVPTGGG